MPDTNSRLAQVNQKILAEGERLPIVKLKDGSAVQTGTVATMLLNVARYNSGERGEVEKELELSVRRSSRSGCSSCSRSRIGSPERIPVGALSA